MAARLGEMLVKARLVSEQQIERALEYQKIYGGKIGEILLKLGFIDEGLLTSFLATQHQLELIDLDAMVIPKSLIRSIPLSLLKRLVVVPISLRNNKLTVATSDPTDYRAIEELQLATNYKVEIVIAKRSAIIAKIREYEDTISGKPKVVEVKPEVKTTPFGEDVEKKSPAPELMVKSLVALLISKGVIGQNEFIDILRKIELYDQL